MWRMESYSSKSIFYVIQKVQENCDCPLRCSLCYACSHMYTCTCLDATLHSTVCKHVHLLCMDLPDDIDVITEDMDSTLEPSCDVITEADVESDREDTTLYHNSDDEDHDNEDQHTTERMKVNTSHMSDMTVFPKIAKH